MRFSGKTVLITGGGSGIGLAAARLFAAEGAAVAINELDAGLAEAAAAGLTAAGATASAYPGDAADPAVVAATVAAVVARFGRIDILVNNVGLFTNDWAEDLSFERWKKMQAVNLDAPFLWATEVARRSMIPNRSGAVVNVASLAGLAAGPKSVAYTAAKHGVVGLTRALAVDWARLGIRVNAVCPGVTETEMVRQAAERNPQLFAIRKERVPVGYPATAEDQARAILYLASPDSTSTTGLIMNIDGGQMAFQSGYSMPTDR